MKRRIRFAYLCWLERRAYKARWRAAEAAIKARGS